MLYKFRVLFALLILISVLPRSASAAEGFVTRSGTQFMLNNTVYNVAGMNNHYLSWASKGEVDAVLNDAAAMNANVVRTFFGPVIGSLDGTTNRTIWDSKSKADSSHLGTNGVYYLYWDAEAKAMAWNDGPDGLQKMDYVIAKARDLKLKILLSFLDFWEYTGGVQQMRAWYGNEDRYDFFFRDQRTRKNYIDWVTHILEHTNTITGVKYKDDPTIFGWDLMNEPQTTSITLMQQWLAEMSAYVKSVDPNHLVSSGSEGFYGGLAGSDPYTELAIPTLDFGTWHAYPDHLGIPPDQVTTLIEQHCRTAARRQKPVLLEEFGHTAGDKNQVEIYRAWTEAIYKNPHCAGWLYWRLTSKMDSGAYPQDKKDQFDIHNDGSPAAIILKEAAQKYQQRRAEVPAPSLTAADSTPVTNIFQSIDTVQPLVPDGVSGQHYFVAFPKTMKLDGDLSQWQGLPLVRLTTGSKPPANPAEGGILVFAAAADTNYVCLMFVAYDVNIIAGTHNRDYWNEDSIEFYLNATGDLTLTSYQPGIVDINIPAANLGRPADEPIISTQQTLQAGTHAYVFKTTTGYAAQVSLPLKNSLWDIEPKHGSILGFEFQLNGASRMDRDSILSWSVNSRSNEAYKDPSVFGLLVFYKVGESKLPPLP